MDKFRELFDQVLLYAQQYQAEMSVQLMKMLYMFLLQKAKPLAKKQEERKGSISDEKTKSPQNPTRPGSKPSP